MRGERAGGDWGQENRGEGDAGGDSGWTTGERARGVEACGGKGHRRREDTERAHRDKGQQEREDDIGKRDVGERSIGKGGRRQGRNEDAGSRDDGGTGVRGGAMGNRERTWGEDAQTRRGGDEEKRYTGRGDAGMRGRRGSDEGEWGHTDARGVGAMG